MKPFSLRPVPGTGSPARPLGTAGASDADEPEDLRRRWRTADGDGGTRRDAMLRLLAERRASKEPAEPLDLRGLPLVAADLSGLDLSGSDLSGADLSRADLRRATLFQARLAGATLFQADLTGAELSGADLAGANLQGAKAVEAGLGLAKLAGASLFEADLARASLTGADLRHADLRVATLSDARLRDANLEHAQLQRACLHGADLSGCRVAHVAWDHADLRRAKLDGLTGYHSASWIGVDVRETDFNGAYLCRRHVLDQNYLEEFKRQSPWTRALYVLWWATSDCGRSFVRWSFVTLAFAAAFGLGYTQVELDYGPHESPLSPFYFSVVTLTTLGYGDAVPASTSAQTLAMVEVLLGYMMLGGLLSIFSNKMARRAE